MPDSGDNTSATIYISNKQVDSGYICPNFAKTSGGYSSKFYTGAYLGGKVDGVIRSMSGTAPK